MGKINRKAFWMECYSLKQYVNWVSPQWKNTSPLWIVHLPHLPTNIALCEIASYFNRK